MSTNYSQESVWHELVTVCLVCTLIDVTLLSRVSMLYPLSFALALALAATFRQLCLHPRRVARAPVLGSDGGSAVSNKSSNNSSSNSGSGKMEGINNFDNSSGSTTTSNNTSRKEGNAPYRPVLSPYISSAAAMNTTSPSPFASTASQQQRKAPLPPRFLLPRRLPRRAPGVSLTSLRDSSSTPSASSSSSSTAAAPDASIAPASHMRSSSLPVVARTEVYMPSASSLDAQEQGAVKLM